MIEEKFLKFLSCPVCNGELTQQEEYLICQKCSRHYPIEDGIVILMPEKATIPTKTES